MSDTPRPMTEAEQGEGEPMTFTQEQRDAIWLVFQLLLQQAGPADDAPELDPVYRERLFKAYRRVAAQDAQQGEAPADDTGDGEGEE